MKHLPLIATMLILPLLAACNTMEGLGKDVQKGGEALENSAQKNRQ